MVINFCKVYLYLYHFNLHRRVYDSIHPLIVSQNTIKHRQTFSNIVKRCKASSNVVSVFKLCQTVKRRRRRRSLTELKLRNERTLNHPKTHKAKKMVKRKGAGREGGRGSVLFTRNFPFARDSQEIRNSGTIRET